MKLPSTLLGSAVLLALAAPAAQAETAIDVIGGSEISLDSLVQADGGNWSHNDMRALNSPIGSNGDNSEFSTRRAELLLSVKGPGNFEWAAGYDPSVRPACRPLHCRTSRPRACDSWRCATTPWTSTMVTWSQRRHCVRGRRTGRQDDMWTIGTN